MTEIDLHGFKHEEVKDKLPKLINRTLQYGNNFPIKINNR